MMMDDAQATPIEVVEVASEKDDQWQSLPVAARNIFAFTGAIWSTAIGIVVAIVFAAAVYTKYPNFWSVFQVSVSIIILSTFYGAWLGFNNWSCTRWKLDHEGMHVQRGRWWKRQTLVPRSRVQHLDIERGPLERGRGLATLNVHTAGTRTQAVSVPGLLDDDAVALRNALVPRVEEDRDDS
jgi:uncharacterized protein